LDRGLINPHPNLSLERVTPAVAALDGDSGFGFVVADRAMTEAIGLAKDYGVGVVSAKHSTHFGMAANYVLRAIEEGFIGMAFTNASPTLPPWGGRLALLGSNPLAFGAPSGREVPFVLDMSPAVAARGKIQSALRRGETIPQTWALDAEGKATSDPGAALGGVLLPIGGPKGSGLSMLLDILCGVISGAAFAGHVGDQRKDFDRPQDVGHFFLALKPDLMMPLSEYRARMDTLVERVRAIPTAKGFREVLMPGELETRQERIRQRRGIPFKREDIASLQAVAANASIASLTTSSQELDD
jgi:LDH2 family malate/lactate/ureidoglycolate dehydrogenase